MELTPTPYTIPIQEGDQTTITQLQLQSILPQTQDYNQLCNTGNYEILKSFTESYGMKADTTGFTFACCNGYLDIIQLLLTYNVYPDSESFATAILNHQFLILQYLFSCGFKPTRDMMYLACRTNQQYLMFYLNKLGISFTPECVDVLIFGNYLPNLEFVYRYGGKATQEGFHIACQLGFERMIDFLLTQGFTMTSISASLLLSGNHIDLFYKYNPPLSYDMWYLAMELRDEPLIEWLYDHGLVPDETILDYAAFMGLKDTVYFFINIGILPTSTTLKMAQLGMNEELTDELSRIYNFSVIQPIIQPVIEEIEEKGDPDEEED